MQDRDIATKLHPHPHLHPYNSGQVLSHLMPTTL